MIKKSIKKPSSIYEKETDKEKEKYIKKITLLYKKELSKKEFDKEYLLSIIEKTHQKGYSIRYIHYCACRVFEQSQEKYKHISSLFGVVVGFPNYPQDYLWDSKRFETED